ncbi:MAG: hypothetical protein EX285_04695 [Thaumarchaeota archaeon]|nr:hypothetical protein [Nitrososphaerota archaeon]
MKNTTRLVILGVLVIALAAIINTNSNAYAKEVIVEQVPGAANANNAEYFVPSEVTINVGDTVIWQNNDSGTHTVTSGTIDDPSTWSEIFESGFAKPGVEYQYTFDTTGDFPYLCQLHPWMIGKVIVKAAMPTPPEPTPEELGKLTVNFEDNSFDLFPSLSNGSVKYIDVDPDFTSIVLAVETDPTVDGELNIVLPRKLIDSKINNNDDEFIVLINGEERDYKEQDTTSTERKLTIMVPAGVEEIEIVGTQVIPEFPIAVIVIMTGTIATVTMVSRFKNIPQL